MKKGILSRLYRHNLSMLTDLYQLTMANGYWENDLYDNEAVFHMFFRKTPFNHTPHCEFIAQEELLKREEVVILVYAAGMGLFHNL